MADDRKYRQQGYQDRAGRPEERRPAGGPPEAGRARGPMMLPSRAVSRCAECGTALPPLADPETRCPKCRLPLHCCKQCSHFDPGRRFECAEPIAERIADKGALNGCDRFSLRVMVERSTSSGSMRPEDARRAFDNLFGR